MPDVLRVVELVCGAESASHMSANRRAELGRWLRDETRPASRFPTPLFFAHALGVHVRRAGVADRPRVIWQDGVVVYGIGEGRREHGLGAYGAVACAVLQRHRMPQREHAIWELACEIALPSEWIDVVDFASLRLIQRYVPTDVLEAWVFRVLREQ